MNEDKEEKKPDVFQRLRDTSYQLIMKDEAIMERGVDFYKGFRMAVGMMQEKINRILDEEMK